jgi:hypothetical protein
MPIVRLPAPEQLYGQISNLEDRIAGLDKFVQYLTARVAALEVPWWQRAWQYLRKLVGR